MMMTKRRILAAVLAAMMCTSLFACGAEKSEPADSDTAVEDSAEVSGDTADADAGEPAADTAEAKEVKAVLDGFVQACKDEDYDAIAKYYDAELVYVLDKEEKPDSDALLAYLKEDNMLKGIMSSVTGSEPGTPAEANGAAPSYADMLKQFDEEDESNMPFKLSEEYVIDGVYSVPMTKDDEDQTDSMGLCVLRINGEWKCDAEVTLMLAFMQIGSSISDDSDETDEADVADEDDDAAEDAAE